MAATNFYYEEKLVGVRRFDGGRPARHPPGRSAVQNRSMLGILPRQEPGLRHPWLRRSAGRSDAAAISASPRRFCERARTSVDVSEQIDAFIEWAPASRIQILDVN
jgi:hypothetical protein